MGGKEGLDKKDEDAWDEDRQEDERRARVGQLLLSSGRQHVTQLSVSWKCYRTLINTVKPS